MLSEYHEDSAEPRVRTIPMSHISLELGHLYLEDLRAGPERLTQLFTEAAVGVTTATALAGVDNPRISTCFLIDDYFSDPGEPEKLVREIKAAAASAHVQIDYLARESACARVTGPAGEVSPAELLISQLVDEPVPETNGSRPPTRETGWLSNGRRSPGEGDELALGMPHWEPPVQTSARGHSIFVDVELWQGDGERKLYSCSLLAAAWQLLRLGLPRRLGDPLVEPVPEPEDWPRTWADLPGLIKLNPRAQPFAAYRTYSVLSSRFLPVELAVRTILSQVAHDPVVTGLIEDLAAKARFPLAPDILDRIGYLFPGGGLTDPS